MLTVQENTNNGFYSSERDPDIFDEDESDNAYLRTKPQCFAVFGPPGSGKSCVARIISQFWKCLLISPETVITELIKKTDTGKPIKEYLHSATGVPQRVALEMLIKKLESNECGNYGFVLDDFPAPELTIRSLEGQFDLLRSIENKIDFVIIIRFSLEDTVRRKESLYFHSPSGLLIPASYINASKEYQDIEEATASELDPDDELDPPKVDAAKDNSEEDGPEPGSAEDNDNEEEGDKKNDLPNSDKPAAKNTKRQNKRNEERGALQAEHAKSETSKKREKQQSDLAENDEADEEVPVLRGAKRTTFGHIRRSPMSTELLDDPVSNAAENLESDILLFRTTFFPDIPLENGKMQFPSESLYLRTEDSVEYTQDDYLDYKKVFLPHIENFMATYYPLRIIELDGNMPLHLVPSLILARFECMRLQKPPVPRPLQDLIALQAVAEDPDVPEVDKQFEKAMVVGAIAPRWKWKRSLFGTLCPVSLFEGQLIAGTIAFATAFLSRLYLLADKVQQDKFLQNPRKYILPPNPKIPTRVIVIGYPGPGKKAIENQLIDQYGMMSIDVADIADQVQAEQKEAFIAGALKAATLRGVEIARASLQEGLNQTSSHIELLTNQLKKLQLPTPPKPVQPITSATEPAIPAVVPDSSIQQELTVITDHTEESPEIPPEQQERISGINSQLQEAKAEYSRIQVLIQQVDEHYPAVVTEIDKIMKDVTTTSIKLDTDRYVGLLKTMLEMHLQEQKELNTAETTPEKGWMLGNISTAPGSVRSVLGLQGNYLATDLVILRDHSEQFDVMKKEFIDTEEAKDPSFVLTDDIWNNEVTKIKHFYSETADIESEGIRAALRVHTFDLVEKSPETAVKEITATLRALFQNPVTEYVEPEQENEEDDEEDEELGTMFRAGDENSGKTKRVGETLEYCPVALKEQSALWPGDPQHGAMEYKAKVYYFSSPEAKEKFTKDPDSFLPVLRPLKAPPVKIFIIGALGTGRTTHAKAIAELIDGFVINVRNFMIESATPKLQAAPVQNFVLDGPVPYWRLPKIPPTNSANLSILEKQLPEGLIPVQLPFLPTDPRHPVVISAAEQASADSLTGDAPLPPEILTGFMNTWLKDPPFAGHNLVFDGFPMYADDAKLLVEQGIFPDMVFLMTLDDEVIADRILPKRKAHWQQEKRKRDEKYFNSYSNKKREWEKVRASRKTELVAAYEASKRIIKIESPKKRADASGTGEEFDPDPDPEEDEEEELANVEQTLDDEHPEPKLADEHGEEESEAEEDAEDRLNDELRDKIEKDNANIDGIKDIFEEHNVPVTEIRTSRSEYLTQKQWKSHIGPIIQNREHLFEKAYAISGEMAKEMLDAHYKRLGKFGTWCPVKIRNGLPFPPVTKKVTDSFPAIYRQYIYICFSAEERSEFLLRPEYYVRQPAPRLSLPVRVAVIGPPKSGKTYFSQRLAKEIGILRISIGDAIRYVHLNLKHSELCRILTVYLTSGTEIPDTLEMLCLEAYLRTTDPQARGWILDGYPNTFSKLNNMMQRLIVPTIVFELVASNKVCVFRSVIETMTTKKLKTPLFNNSQVVATHLAHYKTNLGQIKSYLESYTKNLVEIDASVSKWKMWFTAMQMIAARTVQIQDYVEKRESNLAAPLTGLCVTPHQMLLRLSDEYGPYCPITLNKENVLFHCIEHRTYEFIAEYHDKYYLFATREKLQEFLKDPDQWLPPVAKRTVPPKDQLPRIVRLESLVQESPDWGRRVGFGGMCPVTYVINGSTSSALQYGSSEFMAEYQGNIYQLTNVESQHAFLAQPDKYHNLPEPTKRPPQPEHPPELNHLKNAIPYLETSVAPAIIQALVEVAELRPKHPLLGYKESALVFIANYLKHNNPKNSTESRQVNAGKLRKYSEVSKLAARLMLNVQELPEFVSFGPQHSTFKEMGKLYDLKKELQDDWLTLSPF